jgi:hypothetical protein
MPDISFFARSFLQERMLDAGTGLPFWLNQAISSAIYPAAALTAAGLVSGVTVAQGANFFTGDVTPEVIFGSGVTGGSVMASAPFFSLWSEKGHNGIRQQGDHLFTPSQYTGPVVLIIRCVLSWQDAPYPADPESPMDAVLDAIVNTFNAQQYYDLTPPGLTYNNEIDFNFGSPTKRQGNSGWQKTGIFAMPWYVVTEA